MMLYPIVFVILMMEIVSFFVLLVPLPLGIRHKALALLADQTSELYQQVKLGMKFVLGFVALLFVDGVRRVYNSTANFNRLKISGGVSINLNDLRATKFYSQRNMYLCGFTLFLAIILVQVYNIILESLNLKAEIRSSGLRDQSDDKIKERLLQSEVTQKDIEQLENSIIEKDKEIEFMKHKAKSLSEEYHKILDLLNNK
ncbi:B-cell receptor-associated 31-like protein [Nadsonia fulvescens var. elongata DSM 6958]|uniref:Endoplasmic reticulum transmembrane protein n=1 Tax=Nadsonia fulvescens var. elongata DSM 6958 TaxID=857566 RepID=A0A1E3PIZ8_9ASCO|nr:B-cell receptor-associated 31-like protein [Nadsonia fulvescens var. elongata DSM 6958]